jgi:hypothetical protein
MSGYTGRAKRRDANHADIRDNLRQVPGMRVADTADLGNGFPDLVVGWMGNIHLIEIKDENKPPSKQKLTPDEKKFFAQWEGFRVHRINSFIQALEVLQAGVEEAPF